MNVDASIQHGDVDIDRTPAVAGLRTAPVAINAVDACRDALYGRGLEWADIIREHLAVFGHEQHAVVGLDCGERSGGEPGGVAVQGVLIAEKDWRAQHPCMLSRDRVAVRTIL